MNQLTRVGLSTLFTIGGVLISSPVRADNCTSFLNLFDDQGRTIEAVHLDSATTLNEDHLAVLVEISGSLPTQSAFYGGPTNSRKEVLVSNYIFDPETDKFSGFENARISKVLKTFSLAEGERHLGVWSNGLNPGEPGYFFYLKVVRSGVNNFTVVHKDCYPTYTQAVEQFPEIDEVFNAGTADFTTNIANVGVDTFSAAEDHLASNISSLSSDLTTALTKLTQARNLRVGYSSLRRALRRLKFLQENNLDNRDALFAKTIKKGQASNNKNKAEQERVNNELASF